MHRSHEEFHESKYLIFTVLLGIGIFFIPNKILSHVNKIIVVFFILIILFFVEAWETVRNKSIYKEPDNPSKIIWYLGMLLPGPSATISGLIHRNTKLVLVGIIITVITYSAVFLLRHRKRMSKQNRIAKNNKIQNL